jgi:hypothetical protein
MKNFKESFPDQFKKIQKIECREGWHRLIESTSYTIQKHLNYLESKDKKIDFYWTQIKSKFGGIKMNYSGGDDYINGIIDAAEYWSYSMCEFCGEKGSLHKKASRVDTLCDNHAKEFGYTNAC